MLTERDPDKITWETLPDGDFGLRTPPGGGPIAEEQSYVRAQRRLVLLRLPHDRRPPGLLPQPRRRPHLDAAAVPGVCRRPADEASRARPTSPGSARTANTCTGSTTTAGVSSASIRSGEPSPTKTATRSGCAAASRPTRPEGKVIRWSQPEIVLYDDDPYIRMSYPDLVEEGGKYFLTETQKDVARVHPIDPELLEGLWSQLADPRPATEGVLLALPAAGQPMPAQVALPALPAFTARDSARADYGTKDLRAGLFGGTVAEVEFPGRRASAAGQSHAGRQGLLPADGGRRRRGNRAQRRAQRKPLGLAIRACSRPGKRHHVVVIVDGGPKIITLRRRRAAVRRRRLRGSSAGAVSIRISAAPAATRRCASAAGIQGEIESLRIYRRALRTSEAIGNSR